MEIKADVIDYLGKMDDGVVVSVGVLFEEIYYNGILFYSNNNIVLSMSDSFEKKIELPIELWENYKLLLEIIFSKLENPTTIINSLKEFEIGKYLTKKEDKVNLITEEIDPNEIIIASQSNLI
jgi:hypothetical protein